jgi:hypothetical protein
MRAQRFGELARPHTRGRTRPPWTGRTLAREAITHLERRHATGFDRWTLLGPDGPTRHEPNKDGAPRKLLPGFLSKPPSVTLSELHHKRTPALRDGQAVPAVAVADEG